MAFPLGFTHKYSDIGFSPFKGLAPSIMVPFWPHERWIVRMLVHVHFGIYAFSFTKFVLLTINI